MNPRTSSNSKFVIRTFAIGVAHLQKNLDGNLRPCAYFAKVLQPAHTNYLIYDQELLGVVCAITECRYSNARHAKTTVVTDHTTLSHLPTKESFGCRHSISLIDLLPNLVLIPRNNQPIL
jgi:hypothetical protein